MRRVLHFATTHPLAFVIFATAAWIVVAGVAAYAAGMALGTAPADERAQSLGTLAATAAVLVVMWRWGWLRPSGVARLGGGQLWLATAGLALFAIVVYQLSFFGEVPVDASAAWASGDAQAILRHQAVVGTVEEILFRGFLLWALVRVWGRTTRGLLLAVSVPALIFGGIHILQVLVGNPLDDVLMTILNAFVGSLWTGALVLLGGSVWPAVVLHAVTNATVQIGAAGVANFDPPSAAYAVATVAEVPFVVVGLLLLLRRAPRSRLVTRSEPGRATAPALPRFAHPLLLLVAFGLLLTGCSSGEPTASTPTPHPPAVIPTTLNASERLAIFNRVWHTVDNEYFDPSFGGMDWESIGHEYRQKLADTEDDHTFWLGVLNPMLWELGVSHLVVLPAGMADEIDNMTFANGSLGMDVRLLGDVAVITWVVEGSPADHAGFRPGYVITSVDGWTLEAIAASLVQTPPHNERAQRAKRVQDMRDMLYGDTGEEVVVEYLDAEGQPGRATLAYAPRVGGGCMDLDPSLPPACAEIESRRLTEDIGYIRFSGFLQAALTPVLQAIDALQDAPGLILDIRGNPGGQFNVRTTIASHLVGEPRLWMRYRYRDGMEAVFLEPVDDAYAGDVVILVDEHSASSSEEFSGSLQAMGRATIIGTQTPGNCLNANFVPLPDGALLMYPFGQPQTRNGRILEDNGVLPDVSVALDRSELLQGFDAQLEAAVDYLESRLAE